MLLEAEPSPNAEEVGGDDPAPDQAVHDRLVGCVTKAFPTLDVAGARVERSGGDHVLLVLGNRYAFRFPRQGMHDLALEIEVLKSLRRRSRLSVPAYEFIDPAGRFAGYRFITGVEFTPQRFDGLSAADRETTLDAAAAFLNELHSIPTSAIAWPGRWPRAWTAAEHAGRGIEGLPRIARLAPRLAEPIRRFWNAYRRDLPRSSVLLHGDLVSEHLLLDESSGRLAGIIDFGDVALGDPAQDFLGFWAYGAAAATRVVERYPLAASDPGLLARSRNHFIRYRLDRLFDTLNDHSDVDVAEAAAEIEALLRDAPTQ